MVYFLLSSQCLLRQLIDVGQGLINVNKLIALVDYKSGFYVSRIIGSNAPNVRGETGTNQMEKKY